VHYESPSSAGQRNAGALSPVLNPQSDPTNAGCLASAAQILAEAFAGTDGFALESGPVETNLVWVAVDPSVGTAVEVAAYLRSRGILISVIEPQLIRTRTHLDVTLEQVQFAARVIRQIEPALISAITLEY
jgi:threonine aldolase